MSLQAMTRERFQFLLPTVFNIGPNAANHEPTKDDTAILENDQVSPLEKYVIFLTNVKNPKSFNSHVIYNDQCYSTSFHVECIIKGIMEGETRVLVTSMVMEEILADLNSFKETLSNNIQAELDQFGLKIYNAEVIELR